jgi:[acyl-carrier-protein] S-malonyltransferase
MRDAAAAFTNSLAGVTLRPARAPVACNLTGATTRQPAELARCLAEQIAAPVLWDLCLESVAERGVRCVLEVGPGTTLSAMWRAHAPGIPARSVDEFRSVHAVVEWVTQTLTRT